MESRHTYNKWMEASSYDVIVFSFISEHSLYQVLHYIYIWVEGLEPERCKYHFGQKWHFRIFLCIFFCSFLGSVVEHYKKFIKKVITQKPFVLSAYEGILMCQNVVCTYFLKSKRCKCTYNILALLHKLDMIEFFNAKML